jgi:translation initiation factor 3 subunit J
MQPSNRAELLEYAEMLKKKTAEFENQASYAIFAEEVIRNLVSSLNVDDTRKISSCLTAIINEKQKQLKELQGKGKKKASTKKGINVQRGGELENYADGILQSIINNS